MDSAAGGISPLQGSLRSPQNRYAFEVKHILQATAAVAHKDAVDKHTYRRVEAFLRIARADSRIAMAAP